MSSFTEEQLSAIGSVGKTIVSASAGSGKTTVMIEKIVRYLRSGGDVKEILAVTFTKKAAAQMKEKLKKELIKAVNSPETTSAQAAECKAQLAKIGDADISTIHSFCSKLIRSHFFLADTDSDFTIIDDSSAEGANLKSLALEEVFEEAYENAEEDFFSLLSVYFRKKSDNKLKGIFLDLYGKIRSRADYREFLTSSVPFGEERFYEVVQELHGLLKEKCAYYRGKTEEFKAELLRLGDGKSAENAEEILSALSSLEAAPDYFAACKIPCPGFSPKVRAKKTDAEGLSPVRDALAAVKEKVKKLFEELEKTGSEEEEKANCLAAGETAAKLVKYLLRFDECLAEKKRAKGLLDYNDLEHIALRLVKLPSVQEELRAKYKYVFVDEYQDVNPVQEALISLIGGKNVFLVGDVKQSIYGFRGSKSKYFVQKQEAYKTEEGASSLKLTKNFRSADEILRAVNRQFVRSMTKRNSDIDYAADSVMEEGGRYGAERAGRVKLHLIDEETKAEKGKMRGVYSVESGYLKERAAASAYSKQLKRIIESERASKYYDPDDGLFKRVEYKDIAILVRSNSGRVKEAVSALTLAGIPVSASAAINVCDYPEIKTLIDILSLLDNAEQDIPLCSALLSAMGDFTAEDLSKIRLAYPEETAFRGCCKKYAAEKGDKLAFRLNRFYAYFEKLRNFSLVATAGETLLKLLSDTRMEARLLSRDNGAECLKRIHRFLAETDESEPLSVFEFLSRLRSVDYTIEYSENGGENAVRVLTMHASKGLEYPVVILDDLSSPFHGADRDEVLFDEKFALAPKAYHKDTMTVDSTLLRTLSEKRGVEDSRKDELNLFYVALTRAKYSLHLLFKKMPAFPDVRYASSFADFMDFSLWQEYFAEEEPFDLPFLERKAMVLKSDEELQASIERAFLWEYAHTGAENLPVKSTATELIERESDEVWGSEHFSSPTLFEGETTGDARETGSAYHAFLEHVDFSLLEEGNFEEVAKSERARMKEEKLLGEEQLALLHDKRLALILANPIFTALKGAKIYREREFLAKLPARIYEPAAPETEEMIFQGAIDLLAVYDGDVRIVDYKYSTGDKEYLKGHYAKQLAVYKKAAAEILKIKEEKIRCTIVNILHGFEVETE